MAKRKQAEAAEPERAELAVSLAAHPRARAGIRRARTRAALIAFFGVLALNLLGDQTALDALWRALIAGIVVNLIAWRCAIVVWRHIVLSELQAVEDRRAERLQAAREEFERAAARQREGEAGHTAA